MAPQSRFSGASPQSSPGLAIDYVATAPLERLPVELLCSILEAASAEQHPIHARMMFCNICLTSKTLYAVAISYLYNEISNEEVPQERPYQQSTQFITTLAEHPNLAQHVRRLHLDSWEGPSDLSSGIELWQVFTTVMSIFEDDRDHLHTKCKTELASQEFHSQAVLAFIMAPQVKHISLYFKAFSRNRNGSTGNKDVKLLETILRAKREHPNVLANLRSLQIEIYPESIYTDSTVEALFLVLDHLDLDELSFIFWGKLTVTTQCTHPTSNVKRLTLEAELDAVIDVVRIIEHMRQLEYLKIKWQDYAAPYYSEDNFKYYFRDLVQALIPHKESLRSLIVDTRDYRVPRFEPSPVESLKMFQNLQYLTLDEISLAIPGIGFDCVPEFILPPNLKSLTIRLTNRNLLLFEILGKLAMSAPQSLQWFRATFMEEDNYSWDPTESLGRYRGPEYDKNKTKNFKLEGEDFFMICWTDCFGQFARDIQDSGEPQSSLPEDFPVSPTVRNLINGSSVVSEFEQLLESFPEENYDLETHIRAWWDDEE